MPANWFDLLVVIVLVAGAIVGRKRGMSQELLPLVKWVTLVLVCGFGYSSLGKVVSDLMPFGHLASSIVAYLLLAAIVLGVFALINRQLGGKIVGSDAFGGAEYYLGIISGMFRFGLILIFGLSLLNARLYTQKEIDERNRYMRQNYDSDFFPSLYQVQNQVFKSSFAGPVIHENLDFVLIKPAIAKPKPLRRKELPI